MTNANARFLNEAKELEARWDVVCLSDITDRYVRSTSALSLESVRMINEFPGNRGNLWLDCDNYKQYCTDFFNRTNSKEANDLYERRWGPSRIK